MASVLSNYLGNKVLADNLTNGVCYLALHTADPTVTGLTSTEVAGGSYLRQLITFSAVSSKTTLSTNSQTFTGMPAAIVTYLAVWNDPTSGNMLVSFALSPSITVPVSGNFLAARGDIAVTV